MASDALNKSVNTYLGLGGNQGDPKAAFQAAIAMLGQDQSTEVSAVSSLYSTPPWGKIDQPDFLNAVVAIETSRTPRELLDLCLDIERRLKRLRLERWGPRLIDLDVLWFDDRVVDIPDLKVPHPRMLERAFVMIPLAEIAPDLKFGAKTAAEIAATLPADGIVIADGTPNWWVGAK